MPLAGAKVESQLFSTVREDSPSLQHFNSGRSTTKSPWSSLANPAGARVPHLQLGFNQVVLIHSAKVRNPRHSPSQGINAHLLEIITLGPCELPNPLQPRITKLQQLTIRSRSPANLEGYPKFLLKYGTQTVITHHLVSIETGVLVLLRSSFELVLLELLYPIRVKS